VALEMAVEQPAPGMPRRPFHHHRGAGPNVLSHYRLLVGVRISGV
jgi:hypothetical protein